MNRKLWPALKDLAGLLWNALIHPDYHIHVTQPDGTQIMFGRWYPEGYFVYAYHPHETQTRIHEFHLTRQQAYDEATRAGAPYNAMRAFEQHRTATFHGWKEAR